MLKILFLILVFFTNGVMANTKARIIKRDDSQAFGMYKETKLENIPESIKTLKSKMSTFAESADLFYAFVSFEMNKNKAIIFVGFFNNSKKKIAPKDDLKKIFYKGGEYMMIEYSNIESQKQSYQAVKKAEKLLKRTMTSSIINGFSEINGKIKPTSIVRLNDK